MARYILVDSGGDVVNCVIWSGDVQVWTPPAGTAAEGNDAVSPGDVRVGGVFYRNRGTGQEPAIGDITFRDVPYRPVLIGTGGR